MVVAPELGDKRFASPPLYVFVSPVLSISLFLYLSVYLPIYLFPSHSLSPSRCGDVKNVEGAIAPSLTSPLTTSSR